MHNASMEYINQSYVLGQVTEDRQTTHREQNMNKNLNASLL